MLIFLNWFFLCWQGEEVEIRLLAGLFLHFLQHLCVVHLSDAGEMIAFGIEHHHFRKLFFGFGIDGPKGLMAGGVLVVLEELFSLSGLGSTCRE